MLHRKWFPVSAILLLVSVLLAACASQQPATQSSDQTTSSSSGSPNQPASKEPIKLVVGHTGTPGNSVYVFFDELKKRAEAKSQGALVFEVHHSSELGGDKQLVESLQLGTIALGSAASNNMASFTSAYLWADLPYIFKSRESLHSVWNSPVGQQADAQVTKDVGTKVLAHIDVGGFRLLTNTKREVRTPADMAGLKLRTTASPIEGALTKAWGGNATPVGWSETFTAVQQGVVDGLQLHPVWLALNGFGKVIKHATEVKALTNAHIVQMNMQTWESLGSELQQIVLEAAKEAEQVANEADAKAEQGYKKQLAEEGVQFYTPTETEMQQWRDLGTAVWDQFKDKVDPNVVQAILNAQKE